MAARRQPLLKHIHRLAARLDPEADAVLLERFVRQHDEVAFEALVRRHGPMVLGVCHRVLGNDHDAEDVFQATFLVLTNKAARIGQPSSLSAWLHGVAHSMALKHRQAQRRRQNHEARSAQATGVSPSDPLDQLTAREMLQALDEELQRLRESYRLPLILCCLEGRTQDEVANILGWTPDSVRSRLHRGRVQLHDRLARRGLALGAGLLAAAVFGRRAVAALPAGLARATAETSLRFAAGGKDGIAAGVMALAEGGMRMTGMKIVTVLLGLTLAVSAGGVLAHQIGAREEVEARPRIEEPGTNADTTGRPKPGDKPARTDCFGDPLPPGALARMGTVRLFNGENASDRFKFLAFSPDGKILASHIDSMTVALWDAVTGKEIRRLTTDAVKGEITSLGFSPEGKTLVAVAWDVRDQEEKVCLWDAATGKLLRKRDYQGPKRENVHLCMRTAFLPDGRILTVRDFLKAVENGRGIRGISVWDAATGKEVRELSDSRKRTLLTTTAFSPDGKLLATVLPSDITLWDMATGKEIWRLPYKGPANDAIRSLAFSHDGKMLALADGNAISVWDVTTGKSLREMRAWTDFDVPLTFSPDGKTLVGGKKGHLWEVSSGREICSLGLDTAQVALFSPDGKILAVGDAAGVLSLWEVATGKEIFPRPGHRQPIRTIAYSPDGKMLASMGGGKFIRLWDVSTGKELRKLNVNHNTFGIHSFAYSPDGKKLASAEDCTVYLWDVATGKEILQFEAGGACYSVRFSPDGKRLATSIWNVRVKQGCVVLWDAATSKKIYELTIESKSYQHEPLAFSPDGRILVTPGKGDTLSLWEVATGKLIGPLGGLKLPEPRANEVLVPSLAFSPDGRVIATSIYGDDKIRLWEVASGREVGQLDGYKHREEKRQGYMRDGCVLAFSPDGRMLATAVPGRNGNSGQDLAVTLWEVASGKEIGRLASHRNLIHTLAFSPDGKTLTSGGDDLTCLVWDVAAAVKGQFRVAVADARPTRKSLSKELLEAAWTDLASTDPAIAYRAVSALRQVPGQAVPLLKERVRPAAPVTNPEQLSRWIADLDNESFVVRQKAQRAIQSLGEPAIPKLQRALADRPPLEVKRRLRDIIAAIEPKLGAAPPMQLRQIRAVQVLESIKTPEARQVLRSLAKGAEAGLTREAQAALERLGARYSASRP